MLILLLWGLLHTPAEPSTAHLSESWPKPVIAGLPTPPHSELNRLRNQNRPYSPTQLKTVLQTAGFKGQGLKVAWAVAMRESRGHRNAHNGDASTGDNSYGLFQINMKDDLGYDRRSKFQIENDDLFDPFKNARITYQMTKGGTDWGSWGIGPNSYREDLSHTLDRWLRVYPDD